VGPDQDGHRAHLQQLCHRHGVDQQVHFLDMVSGSAKYTVLREADLFVLPSHQENFGIAVVEAMACELPVIVSDQVNLCSDIEQSNAGVVLALNPLETFAARLAEAVEELHRSPTKRVEAGQRGRAYVQHRFQWSAIARLWVDHYGVLLNSQHGNR
jgi:glycosyltransferase involved in cell wall biosynthesis